MNYQIEPRMELGDAIEVDALRARLADFEKNEAGKFLKRAIRQAFDAEVETVRSDWGEEAQRLFTARANERANVLEFLMGPLFGFGPYLEREMERRRAANRTAA